MKIVAIHAKNYREAGIAVAKKLPGECRLFFRFIQKTIPKKFYLSWKKYLLYISPLLPRIKKLTPDAWEYINGISYFTRMFCCARAMIQSFTRSLI